MTFEVRRVSQRRSKRALPWKRMLLTGLQFARPVLGFYRNWKHRKEKEGRELLLKRLFIGLVAVLLSLVLLAGTVKALVAMRVLNMSSVISVAGVDLPRDEHGYLNVLLMGQGDEDHDGKDLTDTIMIASLDPDDTGSVTLLSLPRDLYLLHTEKMGAGKLNSYYRDYKGYLRYNQGMEEEAAATEALAEISRELGNTLGMDLHGVIKVDFTAFVEAVDALEGVGIDVPYDIVDTEYPDENFGFETFELHSGLQHLDGPTALKYARSRHTSSDFDRSARQQQLLSALAEKAKEEGYIRDAGFIAAMVQNLAKNVETTFSLRELVSLAGLGQKLDRTKMITLQLNDRNALYDGFIEPGGFLYTPPRDQFDGAAVLLPVSIPEFPVTWKQPQALVRLLQEHRDAYLAQSRINILNNGAPSGLARRLATELIRYGFTVDLIANATLPEKQETSSLFIGPESAAPTGQLLGTLLGITPMATPLGVPVEEQGDITIIVGKDYRYATLQDLVPRLNQ